MKKENSTTQYVRAYSVLLLFLQLTTSLILLAFSGGVFAFFSWLSLHMTGATAAVRSTEYGE